MAETEFEEWSSGKEGGMRSDRLLYFDIPQSRNLATYCRRLRSILCQCPWRRDERRCVTVETSLVR